MSAKATPLRRLEALYGASVSAAETSIALWPPEDRALLVRLGILDAEDLSLTKAGCRTLGAVVRVDGAGCCPEEDGYLRMKARQREALSSVPVEEEESDAT